MDPSRFDTLVRMHHNRESRRWILRLLAGLPLAGILATLEGADIAAEHPLDRMRRRTAQRRRKRRTTTGNNNGGSNGNNNGGGNNGNNNGGNNGGSGGLGSGECLTPDTNLQAIIDQASPGDTLTLCAGTFDDTNLALSDSLTIVGAGAGMTILYADPRGYAVMTVSGGKVNVQALTITGATGQIPTIPATLVIQQNSTLNLSGVDVSHNEMPGIYVASGTLSMSNRSSVSQNHGGGIFTSGTVNIDSGCRVTQNSVGGGITITGGTVNLADQNIVFNNQPRNCNTDIDNCVG